MSEPGRARLVARFCEATADIRRAAAEGALDAVASALSVRQRFLDDLRTLDGPWSPAERRALEAAREEDRRALEHLASRRDQLLTSFRELARGRRAVAGYRPGERPGASFLERRV